MQAVTIKRAIRDANNLKEEVGPQNKWNDLFDALSSVDPQYTGKGLNPRGIGEVIRKYKGRVINGQRFMKKGEDHGAAKWQIDTLKGGESDESDESSLSH
jgi:hypothetical protein